MSVDIPKMRLVKTKDLKSDGKNPNVMSKERFQALKKNLQKYGFVVPVITNSELMIADGEHRWKAALEMGMDKIPVISLNVKEVDRRMLRQIMNKLRGEHNPIIDVDEYNFIFNNGKKDEYSELMALTEKEQQNIFDRFIDENKNNINDESQLVNSIGNLQITCPKCGHRFKKKVAQ